MNCLGRIFFCISLQKHKINKQIRIPFDNVVFTFIHFPDRVRLHHVTIRDSHRVTWSPSVRSIKNFKNVIFGESRRGTSALIPWQPPWLSVTSHHRGGALNLFWGDETRLLKRRRPAQRHADLHRTSWRSSANGTLFKKKKIYGEVEDEEEGGRL